MTSGPRRIQRRRTRGWRMPPGAIYCGPSSRWGNPYPLGATACGKLLEIPEDLYDAYCIAHPVDEESEFAERARTELRGKVLACWCPIEAYCHVDRLIEIANRPVADE